MTEREAAPDYDEDADYVIITERIVHSQTKAYHRPAPGGSIEPACDTHAPREDTQWRTLDRSSSRFDQLHLCGHCAGRVKPESDKQGCTMRQKLLDADPADYGCEPIPDAPTVGGAD